MSKYYEALTRPQSTPQPYQAEDRDRDDIPALSGKNAAAHSLVPLPTLEHVPAAVARASAIRNLTERLAPLAVIERSIRLLVTGCRPGDGASTVASAIAIDLSQRLGLRTICVDAHLRHPNLHRTCSNVRAGALPSWCWMARCRFARPNGRGWTSRPAARFPATTSGCSSSRSSKGYSNRYQAAVIDLGVPRLDARMLPLARPDDPILLVVRHGYTERSELATTVAGLRAANRPVAGVVLKRRNQSGCETSEETSRIMSEVVRLGTVARDACALRVAGTHARRGKYKISGIGVVGLGYWGPNWVRNLHQLRQASTGSGLRSRCEAARSRPRAVCRSAKGSSNLEDLLAIATSKAWSSPLRSALIFRWRRKRSMAGKSVLVEKPLAMSSAQAAELVHIARDNGRVLMVGHTFEYSAPVLKMRDIIESGELGDMFYMSSIRANLGLIQHDVNVAWDLATHDISIILMLMGGRLPEAVSCQGQSHYKHGIEDVAMLSLHFPRNVIAFIHVSWLDPNKIRRTTIVGSRRCWFTTISRCRKRSASTTRASTSRRTTTPSASSSSRIATANVMIPRIDESEPLKLECEHFVDCIRSGETPRTDGALGRCAW